MRIFAALFFAAFYQAAAQTPQVPHKMEFAGITLTIRDDARREIQKDVDDLTRSPKHFNIKAERAKTYFPIIEKIFREEQVPEDFKFLALQESALIPDAVSSSDAVGFWQFKDFTALEMGLRVDKEIDERLNIVSSTRAAARYIKKNNTFFDNWVYALQAYQMGAGGVMKSVNDTHEAATHMEINSHTYWYIKRYLAHKIAYEEAVKGKGETELIPYETNSSKTLESLAKEVAADEGELRNYNKWTKSGKIPDDRAYVVLIPIAGNKSQAVLPSVVNQTRISEPRITPTIGTPVASARKKINGLQAIQALAGENVQQLASRAGVDHSKFLKWNEMASNESVIEGEFYFLGRKRIRGSEDFHKVQAGEDLWLISQHYGVQVKKLKKYNRLQASTMSLSPGQMLWLSSTKPKIPQQVSSVVDPVMVSKEETFNWSVSSADKGQVENNKIQTPETESVIVLETGIQKATDSTKILQETVIADDLKNRDTAQQITIRISDLKTKEHIVQPKETLYAIAKIYNIPVMDLVTWNNLDLKQSLKVGQILKLSDTQTFTEKKEGINYPERPIQQVLHEVKSSDTLYSIARQYGVTIKELMDWNEKKDFSLAIGEKLKIFQRQ